MNRYHIKHNKNILRSGAVLLALGFLATGCGGESGPTETYAATPSAARAFDTLQTTSIMPGQSAFVRVESAGSESAMAIIDGIEITEHQYQHGWEDVDAPTVGSEPVRLEAHVLLSGSHSNNIDNDAGCDTVNLDFSGLDTETTHIEAVSLSGEYDDSTLVNWPKDDNNRISKTAVICFAENHEASDGLVIRLSDQTS